MLKLTREPRRMRQWVLFDHAMLQHTVACDLQSLPLEVFRAPVKREILSQNKILNKALDKGAICLCTALE